MMIRIEGIKELQDIQRRAQAVDGEHEVPVSELFTPAFMRKHTSFASFEALIESGGFEKGFDEIADTEREAYVQGLRDRHGTV